MRRWRAAVGWAAILAAVAVLAAAGTWAMTVDPDDSRSEPEQAEECVPEEWAHLGGCTVIHIDRDGEMTVRGDNP